MMIFPLFFFFTPYCVQLIVMPYMCPTHWIPAHVEGQSQPFLSYKTIVTSTIL
jgi:hypothetical protein